MIAFLVQPETAPFAIALLLMSLLGLVEAIGLGGAGIDFDADAPDAGFVAESLDWLNIGRLPLLVLLVVWLAVFGVAGLLVQAAAIALAGSLLPWFAAVPAALAAGMPVTRLASRGLARILPRDEAEQARINAKQVVDGAQIEADRTISQARIAQEQAVAIARQESAIAVQGKSREESQAKAEADRARAEAVAAEEQVVTARETEIAERIKRIELIEASKEAERAAIGIKVAADADKAAATDRAEALRVTAEGEASAAKLTAEGVRARFEVDAAGQRALNEAANILSSDQVSMQTKIALLRALPDIIRESAKPMEAIDSIKIVQVEGLGGGGSGGSGTAASGDGNLADAAMTAALRYRAQAPMIDNLLRELGLDGKAIGLSPARSLTQSGEPPAA